MVLLGNYDALDEEGSETYVAAGLNRQYYFLKAQRTDKMIKPEKTSASFNM
jgi:hypothetical protein